MTPERQRYLETEPDDKLARLTLDEMRDGWHWCIEFDGLLTQGEERTADGCCAYCGFDARKVVD